jgi:mannose-6-phosphate isomerase-like protein (cupin superfamily)
MRPKVIRPGDRPELVLGGLAQRTLLSGTDCEGALAIIEAPIEPRTLAGPLHTHSNEDALWYVVEGEFGAQVGDSVFHEGPGAIVLAPRGIPHTYWNPGDTPARYLEMAWPSGLEHFVAAMAHLIEDGDQDPLEGMAHLTAAFGLEMDWDSVAALSETHGVHLGQG